MNELIIFSWITSERVSSIEALKENLWEYRKEIYANGDSDSIFYVDILVAVIICSV